MGGEQLLVFFIGITGNTGITGFWRFLGTRWVAVTRFFLRNHWNYWKYLFLGNVWGAVTDFFHRNYWYYWNYWFLGTGWRAVTGFFVRNYSPRGVLVFWVFVLKYNVFQTPPVPCDYIKGRQQRGWPPYIYQTHLVTGFTKPAHPATDCFHRGSWFSCFNH